MDWKVFFITFLSLVIPAELGIYLDLWTRGDLVLFALAGYNAFQESDLDIEHLLMAVKI